MGDEGGVATGGGVVVVVGSVFQLTGMGGPPAVGDIDEAAGLSRSGAEGSRSFAIEMIQRGQQSTARSAEWTDIF